MIHSSRAMIQQRPTLSNVEAERAYLACLLSAPWLIEKSTLSPADFHDLRNSALFTIFKELYGRDPSTLEFDHTLLKDRLGRISLVQESNWDAYLNEIMATPGDLGRAGDYQDIIADMARRRTRLAELTAEAKVLLDPSTPALTAAG